MRREVASLFGLIVLVLNLWAGVLLSARPAVADPLNDRFVICTAAGMIVVDHDGRPVDTDPAQGHLGSPHCPLCLPIMHGFAPADSASAALPVRRSSITAPTIAKFATFHAPRLSGGVSARAPPLS